MKVPGPYVGKWRIVQMDQWDQEFVDLVVPGYLTIRKDGKGSFQFGAVEGQMDCRVQRIKTREQLEFTWDGFDECDPVSGRDWVHVEGRSMSGHLFFTWATIRLSKQRRHNEMLIGPSGVNASPASDLPAPTPPGMRVRTGRFMLALGEFKCR